ncbi:hypothetical protein L195_g022355 [Trifolium pratense]|uniref:DUF761 domain protein n=2 Tax=Trifolium pratense TaxID=57577 RepID=A0A2K3N7S0_TRIPR|nr:hypothetical protein L195_g022355 [Trifolium pratense]CAJ2661354.1 unnamed protein product [Trifolium pratense]
MRRSYIPVQPSSDLKQREEKSTTNMKEKMSNPSTSSSPYDHHNEAKKAENSVETNNKKLERKTTEDINASADAFIKNFRQQLMIQRLQSIENYEKMLARGL